ncbi:Alpha/Beta hydrolase protein [Neurospora tetraspora]|uniref:Carboxylic ester hydrolase n=1 Tax=Neurospora tetraspora TaxID=94610 RepID=A0AAE0JQ33_9PEZI|nr:Alpha/Beta hydrolase protein [Neurospora tetraspora]
MKFSSFASGLLALGASFASAAEMVKRASLQQVTNFGSNPSGVKMYIYVPNKLATKPAIIVAIHYCSGTASAFYQGTQFAQLADTHGYIVIYPESPYSGTCWDVSSPASLTHNGGGNSNSIANMVTYTIKQYGADASKVFVTGTSSGAMMTNVMAATYPEMFAAASVYAGVPAGCFYTGTVNGWNSTCSGGKSIHTQQEWANTVFNMYPGYAGKRPRILIHHGSADTTLYPQNFNETLKQWAGVFGYTYGQPRQTISNQPASGWTKYVYGPNLVGDYGAGITHNIPVFAQDDLEWFGITGNNASPSTAAPTTTLATSTKKTSTAPATTSSASNGECTSQHWGQCGGNGWTGCTVCASPYTCQKSNDWYSQCL